MSTTKKLSAPQFDLGRIVLARTAVTEEGFQGADVWQHCAPGEVGHIVDDAEAAQGFVVVRFWRTGTATDVDCEERR